MDSHNFLLARDLMANLLCFNMDMDFGARVLPLALSRPLLPLLWLRRSEFMSCGQTLLKPTEHHFKF